MSDYVKLNIRYSNFGLNITHDPITLPYGKFTFLTNVISLFEGNLRPRLGQSLANNSPIAGNPSVVGFRRLNNSVGSTAQYIIRAGTALYASTGTTIPLTIGAALATGFSSNFGSIVVYRPSISASVWAYVFDSAKMVKTNGTIVNPIGYPRPHSESTAAGVDFSATLGGAGGSLTANSTYYYRFSLYDSSTGAESLYNLIPDGAITTDVNATTSGTNFNIDIVLPDLTLAVGSGGAQGGVDKARIYRKGGTITTWRRITEQAYTGTSISYNDSAADSDVQGLDPIDEDSEQPFVTTNTSGVDVPGTPLPYSTDPYLGYILAVGDPNNPGYMYWTNKFDPDRQDPDNRVEVTSPQDPLQNIITYNGRPLVFSKEGLYDLYIGLGDAIFTPSKTPCNRGLFTPLAVAIGPEVYFLAKDGIYATVGGIEHSLTDDELRPIFQGTTDVNGVSAVDYTAVSYLRMAFFRNELWFQYKGLNGIVQYLIYDTRYQRWRHSFFGHAIASIYADEETYSQLFFGSTDGYLLKYSGTTDALSVDPDINCQVTTGVMTFGAPLVNKEFGQLILDIDPQSTLIIVNVGLNNSNGPFVLKSGSTSASTRTKFYLPLDSTVAEDMVLDIGWGSSTATPIIYGYEILYRMEEPELTAWYSTGVTHGIEGWQILRSAYITLIADGTVDFTVSVVNDDGSSTDSTYTLTPGSGDRTKLFVPFNPTKGKLFKYSLLCNTATSFRFYTDQSEVHVKPWITSLGYATVNPFAGEGKGDAGGGIGIPHGSQPIAAESSGGGGGGSALANILGNINFSSNGLSGASGGANDMSPTTVAPTSTAAPNTPEGE